MTAARAVTARFSAAYRAAAPVPGDPILASDVLELRQAIDTLRAQNFGLAAYGFTDAPLAAGVAEIRAPHVAELRAALDQAFAAAGVPAPAYTDPTLVPGETPCRSTHVAELRAAVAALEPLTAP
jgi:hypothetical protein